MLLAEYVLSTLDKVTNWARQGSMWPMTFGKQDSCLYCVIGDNLGLQGLLVVLSR